MLWTDWSARGSSSSITQKKINSELAQKRLKRMSGGLAEAYA
jgi:hypothetical protein